MATSPPFIVTGTKAAGAAPVMAAATGSPAWTDVATEAELDAATQSTWIPSDLNYLGWTFDPVSIIGSVALTPGIIYIARINLREAVANVASVVLEVGVLGATLANCFAAVLGQTGTQIGVTGDQSAVWTSTGVKTMALTTPIALIPAGFCFVCFLVGSASTNVQIRRGQSVIASNGALAAADGFRTSTFGTGQTSIPASIALSGMSAYSNLLWGALDA